VAVVRKAEEAIVGKNNSKKGKKGKLSESDRRSQKAFKLTAHITKSNAQTLQEVRAGTHV